MHSSGAPLYIALILSVLLTGSLSQSKVNPAQFQQMSALNPAQYPGGCDAPTLADHVTSVANNIPLALTTNGGAIDRIDYFLRGRNMSNPADNCSEIPSTRQSFWQLLD